MTADQPVLVEMPAPIASRCGACEAELKPAPTGRPALYCNTACRSAAYRRRRAEMAPAETGQMSGQTDRRALLLDLADAIRAATITYCDALEHNDDADPELLDEALAGLRAAGTLLIEQASVAHRLAATGVRDQALGPASSLLAAAALRDDRETMHAATSAAGGGKRDDHETPPSGRRLRELVDLNLAQQRTQESANCGEPAPPSLATNALTAGEGESGTVWPSDPVQRGLGTVDVTISLLRELGDSWKLEGWSGYPDVFYVTVKNHVVGWVARGIDGVQRWVAVYEGHFLGDAVTQEAFLYGNPVDAARTIQQAHRLNL